MAHEWNSGIGTNADQDLSPLADAAASLKGAELSCVLVVRVDRTGQGKNEFVTAFSVDKRFTTDAALGTAFEVLAKALEETAKACRARAGGTKG